jgi:hypothetical protein
LRIPKKAKKNLTSLISLKHIIMIKKLLLNNSALKLRKRNSFLATMVLTAMLLLGTTVTRAQGSIINDYLFAESIGPAYVDLVGATSVPGAGGASFAALANFSAPIGFTFVYNNATYTNAVISDNGFITFGATLPGAIANPISNVLGYNGAISGYGTGLVGNYADGGALTPSPADGADVSYITTGAPGNRIFTVEYKNVKRRPVATTINGFMNFQIRLYEVDQRVEIQYKSFTSTNATAFTGQVGLRGLTTADWQNRTSTAPLGVTTFFPSAAGALVSSTEPTRTPVVGVYVGPPNNAMFTWTPTCFNSKSLVTNLQVDNTTVNFSWTAAAFQTASFVDYLWEVRTAGLPGSGPVGLYASGNTALTSASVTGLTAGIAYCFYVKSSCKPWTQNITGCLTPLCSTPVYPYAENFEGVVVPAIPNCTSTVVTTGAAMVTVNNGVPYYGFTNKNLKTGSVAATDTWFFTRLISLTAGTTYKVSYIYGGSRELAQFTQKLQVKIGTVNTAAGMTILLADHNSIKSSPNTFTFHFVASGTGNYFLGFNGYAAFNQGYLQIDEISLGDATCQPPTLLTSGQITYNSAKISWTPSVSAPSAGYEYIVSTTNTTPIATSLLSGVTSGLVSTLTSLTPSTPYYYWVRSNCGGVLSAWTLSSTFTTLAAPPVPCVPSPISTDGTGITNVTVGSINNTTGAEVGNYGNYTNLSTNIAQTQSVSVFITYRTGFTYNTKIWIDWNNDGDFYDTGENVQSGVSTNANPTTLLLTFVVPISIPAVTADTSGPHRMRIGGADSDPLTGITPTTGPCYSGPSSFFGTFEDYSVFVTSPPPPLSVIDALTNTSVTFCSGGSSPLVTVNASAITPGPNKYDNFVWNPASGVSGNEITGYTFNPTTPGANVYTLTATQAGGLFLSNTATYTVNVNEVPTPILFTPAAITACEGIPVTLTTSGGIISGAIVIEENFNGPTNLFTTINNSTGGSRLGPVGAAWTLRPSPYLEPFNSANFSSNDASQFIMSNSDAQGSGGNTNTELISPAFSLALYSNVNLSFWHRYRDLGGTAEVQITNDSDAIINNGETWTTLQTYNSQIGSDTNFVNVIINLSAYTGQTNLRIKFIYINAPYAWWWCIDNFKITGSAPALLTWAPATGLWTDPTANTTPYVLGTPAAVVYGNLSSNQTYTATATSIVPPFCSTSTPVNVTVTNLSPGVATGNQVLTCGDTTITTNIVLTGYVPNVLGSIIRWDMADNPGFVGATPIPLSAGKAVLTSADIPALTATTYYRAVVLGCGTVFSNTITVSYPTVTYNGVWSPGLPTAADNVTITSGTLTLSSDMSMCSLKINGGATVVVNPGVTLTVNGVATVAIGGVLTLNDSSSLMQNPTTTVNTNTGNATYRRNYSTRKFDYTYWGAPLSFTTVITLSPGTLSDKYLRYDSNASTWLSIATNTPMAPGLGYAIRGFQLSSPTVFSNLTGIFGGVPNNGDYTVPVFLTIPAALDLNLLGNPYASPLDADELMDGNPGVLGAFGVGTTLYFWTHNTLFNGSTYTFSDYAVYNRTGGTIAAPALGANNAVPSGIISTGQGFMIKAVTAGNVTFRNSMRVAGTNSQFFRLNNNSILEKNRLWLDFTNVDDSDEFKQVLVGYIENATNSYENGFDGDIIEAGNTVSFYSIADSKNLAIQGRALPFNSNDQVAIGYKSAVMSNFKIALSNMDGLFEDTSVGVYLEDTLLNVIHDLRQSPYQFVTEAGTFDSRFILRYNNTLLNVNQNELNNNNVIVFKQNEKIRIETTNIMMKSVKVFDIHGRLILAKDAINSQSATLQKVGLANQVLMVQITSVDGVIVNKKIIF